MKASIISELSSKLQQMSGVSWARPPDGAGPFGADRPGSLQRQRWCGAMSGDYEEDVCRGALTLLKELCFSLRALEQHEKCLEFTDLLRNRGHPPPTDSDISVSLLSVIVTFCGIVLLGVSLFVSWKLCWVPWRDKGASPAPRKDHGLHGHLHHSPFGDLLVERVELGPEMPERSYLDMDSYPEATLKLSQTSPALPVEGQVGPKEGGGMPNAHSHQQVATLAPAPRVVRSKRERYKQRAGEAEHRKAEGPPCGRISFALRYAYASEQLVVKILRALDLPAKDANGFSDPYVKMYLLPDRKKKFQTKMYLLPDRKKKFQTKVHRKTLNPVFNETFNFNVPFAELPGRKLHFSVYDFDRFSRHDLIGQVVLDNLLEMAERDEETPIWRDILEGSSMTLRVARSSWGCCAENTAPGYPAAGPVGSP
ncbi:Synaptotagmin-C [Chelonia mydas]|uniref:Synaptotagmin-C n=1 Tax=Chelonia mydas TaxID=8469 RepID=M7BZ91_CHEMY|nr:Synaptotagmin-C [Chelonia mydas]